MKSKEKYIGLNQKIQFDVLDTALYYFLKNDQVSKEELKPHILNFIHGENRVNKTASYVLLILKRQSKLLTWLKSKLSYEEYVSLPVSDRYAITYCLMALTFPIGYETMVMFSSVFKVQDVISREAINLKMAAKYGSNRSMFNAMDSLLQMLMEQGKIVRVKIGLYSMGEVKPVNSHLAKELIIYTDIKLSNSKSILVNDIENGKFYSFFNVKYEKEMKLSLIKFTDGMMGGGYLGV